MVVSNRIFLSKGPLFSGAFAVSFREVSLLFNHIFLSMLEDFGSSGPRRGEFTEDG